MGDPLHTEKVLSLFYELSATLKQVEVNFTIGEAITFIAGGWKSAAMETYLDIADIPVPSPSHSSSSSPSALIEIDSSVMEGILNKIFTELLPSGKAAVKKAVCIWMLCLVKFCYNVDVIKVIIIVSSIINYVGYHHQ